MSDRCLYCTVGEATVLEPFTVTEGKQKLFVAGCRCCKGMLQKKKLFKLVRNGDVLTTGNHSSSTVQEKVTVVCMCSIAIMIGIYRRVVPAIEVNQ